MRKGHNGAGCTMNDGSLLLRDMWRGVEVIRPMTPDVSEILQTILHPSFERWGRGIKFFGDVLAYNIASSSILLNDLVRKEGRKYDVVSTHDWLSVFSGLSIKNELKLPMVFHVHSTEKGRTFGGGSNAIYSLEYEAGKRSEMVITVSYAMRDELISLGFEEKKIRVVYNGIDVEAWNPDKIRVEKVTGLRERYGISEKDPMILFVGRLTGVKGVDRLVMAMPHVLRKIPNAKLVIVGMGDLEKHLDNLASTLNVQDKVVRRYEFLGDEEKMVHYAACDVAVFPSLYEPFGIVSLEAMSMGKPVVVGARDVSGMREQVIPSGPDQCGFHVNPHEPSDIAWGLIAAISNRELNKTYGANARKRVVSMFTWEKAADATVKAYEEVASARWGESAPR
ncbi:MAG: glycosyltransferase family 4 protein [Candidatus Brockarchaeota archaeon]|nr:glycosyltransferase family 4 protein [Candidatus Brockarchaeota archaeon]